MSWHVRLASASCWHLVLLLFSAQWLTAGTVVLDFEGFGDGSFVTTQYPGVTFVNAQILTADISLNQFEFPPHSGVNVIGDTAGPVSISFSQPVLSFGGYFTYAVALALAGFDATNNQVAMAISAFANNEALSGDPSSRPNEFLEVVFVGGISRVTITGDLLGGSFALDDATFAPAVTSSVPEPGTGTFLLVGALMTLIFKIFVFSAGWNAKSLGKPPSRPRFARLLAAFGAWALMHATGFSEDLKPVAPFGCLAEKLLFLIILKTMKNSGCRSPSWWPMARNSSVPFGRSRRAEGDR